MQALVADDDRVTTEVLARTLERWTFEVTVVSDGAQAWEALRGPDAPSLAILDWMMPVIDGPQVCRLVRSEASRPHAYLILLTSRNTSADIVAGLEAGADDYLVKPVRHHELLARINAVTRRLSRGPVGLNEEIFGMYRFVPSGRQAYHNQESIDLTAKEFELAIFLFKNSGKLLSRELISNSVWGRPISELSRTIDTHISRIRKKLDISPENGYRLQPIYNAGYRLERVTGEGNQ